MTDEGLRALASAGCGENLALLALHCECVPCVSDASFSSPHHHLLQKHADLPNGLTDEGLRALAAAGCGEKLTSLTLLGSLNFFSLVFALLSSVVRIECTPSSP